MDKSFVSMVIQLLIILSLIQLLSSTVIQNPCQASDGENVTISCALFVPNDGERFTSIETNFIIGNIDDFIPKYIIDSNITYNGIDLSRFTANAPLGNSKNVNGSLTLLSYNSSTDKDLRMGCYNRIRPNGASMSYSFNQTIRLVEKSNILSIPPVTMCPLNVDISMNSINKQVSYIIFPDPETSIKQNPPFACEGEKITISCVLEVPDSGYEFTADEIRFNINGIMNPLSTCMSMNPPDKCKSINISRFMSDAPTGSYTSVSGSITFFYNSSTDKNLTIGCMNNIIYRRITDSENYNQKIQVSGSDNPCTTPSNSYFSTTISFNGTLIIIGCAVGVVVFLLILIILIILCVLLIIFLRKRKENPRHTGTYGSDVKEYEELEEVTYSQVKKKSKLKPEPVKKDENELTYLEIDHNSGTGKIVKPPTIPKTNYADIVDLPETTQYVSLQN